MTKFCEECGDDKGGKFYDDPRNPPIGEMCGDCYINSSLEVIEELADDLRGVIAEAIKFIPKDRVHQRIQLLNEFVIQLCMAD